MNLQTKRDRDGVRFATEVVPKAGYRSSDVRTEGHREDQLVVDVPNLDFPLSRILGRNPEKASTIQKGLLKATAI